MFRMILLSLGSLIFTLLLYVIYKYKAKMSHYENKYFSSLLLVLSLVLITEIVSVFTIKNHWQMPLINEIVCRLHCLLVLGWVTIIACYIVSFLEKENDKIKIINYKPFLILFIISLFF